MSFQVLAIDPLLCVRASVTSKTSFSWVLKAWYVFHLLVLLRLGPHPAPSQAGCRIPEIRALCWAGGDFFFVHLPPQLSQSDAEQHLISPSGLCRLETKYQLFLSLDDIYM